MCLCFPPRTLAFAKLVASLYGAGVVGSLIYRAQRERQLHAQNESHFSCLPWFPPCGPFRIHTASIQLLQRIYSKCRIYSKPSLSKEASLDLGKGNELPAVTGPVWP